MVYGSDFYTTRSYSSRPVVSSYSVSRKPEIPWEKVPFVPRPSLVAEPITAFGKRNRKSDVTSCSYYNQKPSILDPINRANIKPSQKVLSQPIKPYISARDQTRSKVLNLVKQHIDTVEAGGSTAASTFRDSMDLILPQIHGTTNKAPHRRIFFTEPTKYLVEQR